MRINSFIIQVIAPHKKFLGGIIKMQTWHYIIFNLRLNEYQIAIIFYDEMICIDTDKT